MQNKFLSQGIAASSIFFGGAALLSSLLSSGSALGAGFEKNILFSGKYAGRGGAGVSDARGAEALFFNPAGLAEGSDNHFEVTGDLSPTWGHFEGPLVSNGVNVNGNATYDTLYGGFASYNISPHWGIGVGSYTGAGAHTEYDGSTFDGLTNDIKSRIYDVEAAVGTGVEVFPGLRVGAAWRVTHVSAAFNSFNQTQLSATEYLNSAVQFNNMGVWRYNGFKLGAQYTAPDNSWGLGVAWRTRVDFNTSGNFTGNYNVTPTATSATAIASGTYNGTTATLGSSLPSQITVGGNYEILPKTLRGFLEYVWTEYDVDQQLNVGGSTTLTGAVGAALGTQSLLSVPLGFKNQTNIRVGFECTAMPNWVYRIGYVWTSQVTPNALGTPLLEPPAHGDTLTLGTGTTLFDMVELNGALEYDWVDGYGTGPGVNSMGQFASGEYTAKGYGLHLGATYRF